MSQIRIIRGDHTDTYPDSAAADRPPPNPAARGRARRAVPPPVRSRPGYSVPGVAGRPAGPSEPRSTVPERRAPPGAPRSPSVLP
eukprot:767646-Hanusia_phi.AAC.13